MEKYSPDITTQMEKPNIFFNTVYAGVGLKFGKMNYPVGSIEFRVPYFRFSQKSNSFVKTEIAGFNIQTSLYIPVAKKHKLTYSVID